MLVFSTPEPLLCSAAKQPEPQDFFHNYPNGGRSIYGPSREAPRHALRSHWEPWAEAGGVGRTPIGNCCLQPCISRPLCTSCDHPGEPHYHRATHLADETWRLLLSDGEGSNLEAEPARIFTPWLSPALPGCSVMCKLHLSLSVTHSRCVWPK